MVRHYSDIMGETMQDYKKETIRQLQNKIKDLKFKIQREIETDVASLPSFYQISKTKDCKESPFGICCFDIRLTPNCIFCNEEENA